MQLLYASRSLTDAFVAGNRPDALKLQPSLSPRDVAPTVNIGSQETPQCLIFLEKVLFIPSAVAIFGFTMISHKK
jgi:hypothetical protein